MKLFITLILITLSISSLTACSDSYSKWVQVGYFKDEDQRRVFLFQMPEGKVHIDKIKAHAAKQMNTKGQVTVTAYLSEGCREIGCRSDVTLAPNFQAALDRVFSPQMAFIAWTMPGGMTNVFECSDNEIACTREPN